MKRKILNSLLTFSIFFSSLVIPLQTIVQKVKAAGVQTATFVAVADTYITPSTYWTGNGGRRFIALGHFHDTTINAYNEWANGLIRFQNINLPQGAIVTEATLELWHYATATWGAGTGNYTFYVRRVTEGWSESTVWSGSETGNGGISATGDYGRFTFPNFDTVRSSDIEKRTINLNTNLINELRTNPNNGIMIDTYNAYDGGAAVCSQDPDGWCTSAMIPKLHVKYVVNQKPDTPNPISPDNSTYINGNCDESVIPATGICRAQTAQDFQAKVNDPDTLSDMDMQGSRFYFSGANNFSSPEIAGDNWTTITYNALLNDGYTNWNVQSKDKQAALSDFSQTFNITTDTTPPEIPVLNGLAEWTPAVGLNETVQVTVTASKVTDNVSTREEVGYVLQYSKDSSFDPLVSEVFEYSSQYFSNPIDQSATFQIGPKGLDQIEGTADDLVDGNTYYFRAKAHDKAEVSGEKNTSAWSNIVSTSIDGTLPEITNYSVTDNRFSPNNATSVGIKDSITFSFDYSELHPGEAKIEIYSDETGTNLIKSLVKLDLAPSPEPTALSFEWDGKDNAGNYIADGPYVAFAIMTDLAGNRSYGNLDFNATNIPSEVIVVDNNEANISISSPYNNYWTNILNLNITGQVKAPHDEGEEDQDLENFQITISNTQTAKDVSYDSLGLFTQNVYLDPGKNDFNFKSTDTVGNTGEKSLTIYTENIAPEISNVLPTGLSNNRKPIISFDVIDPNTNSDQNQVSNIPVGTNPKDMQVWLTFISLDQSKNIISNTKKLIENGVNLDPALVGDLTCVPVGAVPEPHLRNGLENAESTSCSLPFIEELQPDTTYKIHIQVSDIAGNVTKREVEELTLDSHIFSEVYTPVDQGIYSTSDILFTGKASRYSNLTISNDALNLTETLYVDEPTLINASSELFVLNSLDLTCGEFVDTDNRFDTPDEEICNWSVRVKQSFFNQDKDKTNVNTVIVSDEAGNSMSHSFNLIVNLYKFDLAVASDFEYFSPNGDGRQDGLSFFHSATNPTDPINHPRIANYKIVIQESAAGNKTVRELSGVNNLPAYTIFDGKWDDPATPNNQFTWLPDGAYQYYLEVTTEDGATVKTEPKSIFAKTELTNELFITSPQTGFVTTEGVVTISGQAPTDQSTDGTGVLRGDVKVLICVDTITPETPADCDGWYEVSADSNGFFSSIVVLPRIGSYDQTTHIVTAVAQDQFGNRTEESNAVSIILDTVDPFTSVSITPSLTGITSDADYEKFLNGEISIDQIRTVKLTANVTGNTEQVQFALADFTNPITGSPYYIKPENVDYNFIALVNNQTESNIQLNPFDDPAIKANHEVQIGSNIPNNYCNQSNCSWSYYMPLYTGYAGTYEVEFTGKKGETIQSMTAGFRVDGSIQSAPIIMIVEKWDEETDSWIKLDNVNLAHYTEGGKLRFRGAADPGTYLELVGKNADGTIVVLASVTVPETGVFEMIIDLDPLLKAPGNGNGEGNGLECREWKTGEGNEKKCVKGDFNFGLIGWEVDENGNLVNPVEGENGVEITYDEILPGAESIVRTTEELAIEGWAKTGDQAKFLLTANEELQYADILKEDGYQVLMSKLFHFNVILSGVEGWAGVINIDRKEEGIYYPQIRLVDQSGNIQSYDSKALCGVAAPGSELTALSSLCDFRIFIDNTKPEPTYIDKSEWSTKWEEGGINASPYTEGSRGQGRYSPEVGRTNPEYVIKGDYVTIRGKAEKNQRVELHITTGTPTQILGTSILNPLKKEVVYVPVSNSNCQLPISNQKDKVTQDGLTVKYAESCDWSYTYTFKDDGSNSWDGVPNHGYTFQVRTIDKAANYSEFTKQEIVYHDKQAPSKPQIYEARSASYDPIVDWQVDGAGGRAITKDMAVTLKSYAERFADMEYTVVGPKGNQVEARNFINDTTTEKDQSFNIGVQTTDDRAGCTQMVNLRKVGICNDGVYSFNLRATDAAGNKSESLTGVKVERDTVAPAAPSVELSKNGSILQEFLGVKIKGEPNSIAIIGVEIENSETMYKRVRLNENGEFSTSNLIGMLQCGEKKYSVSAKLIDRAGNIGEPSLPRTIKSEECPSCGFGEGAFIRPIHDSRAYKTSGFGWRVLNGENNFHGGMDISGVPLGTPVYAAAPGKVVHAGYDSNCDSGLDDCGYLGFANYVKIDHGNGVTTYYGHLMHENSNSYWVKPGDYVTPATQIGRMGTTGASTGPHLHFEVRVNGVRVNPELYLGKEETNLTPEQFAAYCKTTTSTGGDANNSYPKIEKSIAISKFKQFIDANINDNSEIANDTNSDNPNRTIKSITDLNADLDKLVHDWCGVWVLDFGYISEKNGGTGYDGIAILNPFDQNVYLIKSGIWEKYRSVGGPCSSLGVPKSTNNTYTEQNAGVRSDSKAINGQAWYQRFETAKYHRNSIYAYNWNYTYSCGIFGWGTCTGTNFSAYTVRGEIAEMYENEGGTWGNYKFPVGDEDQVGCQNFEGGELCTSVQSVCRDLKHGNYKYKLWDEIWSYYWDNGGCEKFGLPTGDKSDDFGSGYWFWGWQGWARKQPFEKADIVKYQKPYGINMASYDTYYIESPFRERFSQWEDKIHVPTKNKYAISGSCGVDGYVQEFKDGNMYASDRGTFTLYNHPDGDRLLSRYYEVKQAEGNEYEWPTTDTKLTYQSTIESDSTYTTKFQRGIMKETNGILWGTNLIEDNGWDCDNADDLVKRNKEFLDTYPGIIDEEFFKSRLKYYQGELGETLLRVVIAENHYNSSIEFHKDTVVTRMEDGARLYDIWSMPFSEILLKEDLATVVSETNSFMGNTEDLLENVNDWIAIVDIGAFAFKVLKGAITHPDQFILGIIEGIPACITDTINLITNFNQVIDVIEEILADPSILEDLSLILQFEMRNISDADAAKFGGRLIGEGICEYLLGKGLGKISELSIVQKARLAIKTSLAEFIRPTANFLRKLTDYEFVPSLKPAWDLYGTSRGDWLDVEYAKYLELNHLGQNFPTIDVLDGDTIRSFKSLDLDGSSYLNPTTLKNKGIEYIDALDKFTERTWGGVTVGIDDYKFKQIDFIIAKAPDNPDQANALIEILEYAKSKNIKFNFVITK